MSRTYLSTALLAAWVVSAPALVRADSISSIRVFPTSAITPDDNVVLQLFYVTGSTRVYLTAPVTVDVNRGEVVVELSISVGLGMMPDSMLVNIDLGCLPVGDYRYVVNVHGQRGDEAAVGRFRVNASNGAPETERGTLYWAEFYYGSLLRSTADGSRVESLPVAILLTPASMEVSGSQGYVFWTNSADLQTQRNFQWTLQRADLSGRGVENLSDGSTGVFTLDDGEQMIYWFEGQSIKRARFDGSDVETLLPDGGGGSYLTWDPVGRCLYWMRQLDADPGQLNAYEIVRLFVGQMDVQVVVSRFHRGKKFALDPLGQKIYWTDMSWEAGGAIRRANLDGTNVEELVAGERESTPLALVPEDGKMYWVDRLWGPNPESRIMRASLDGSDVEVLVDRPLFGEEVPHDLIIDPVSAKMYWALYPYLYQNVLHGKIQRANLDGTNVEDVVAGLGKPRAMQFLREFVRDDVPSLSDCLGGPYKQFGTACRWFDSDNDQDVDLRDAALLVNTLKE